MGMNAQFDNAQLKVASWLPQCSSQVALDISSVWLAIRQVLSDWGFLESVLWKFLVIMGFFSCGHATLEDALSARWSVSS